MKVTPIIAPSLDWQSFITEVHQALGRSPTASLNLAGLKPGLLRTVVPALGEFSHEHTAAIPFMKGRDSDQVLAHLHMSFLIEAEEQTICHLMAGAWLRPLMPDDCSTVAILTGSLCEWRKMVIAGSRVPDTREVVDAVYTCLVKAGLGDLFADCKVRKDDGLVVIDAGFRVSGS